MNVDKIIEELEGKQTLLIFLRDNFPDVLEKYKNRNAVVTSDSTSTAATIFGNGDEES